MIGDHVRSLATHYDEGTEDDNDLIFSQRQLAQGRFCLLLSCLVLSCRMRDVLLCFVATSCGTSRRCVFSAMTEDRGDVLLEGASVPGKRTNYFSCLVLSCRVMHCIIEVVVMLDFMTMKGMLFVEPQDKTKTRYGKTFFL